MLEPQKPGDGDPPPTNPDPLKGNKKPVDPNDMRPDVDPDKADLQK